MHEGSGLVVDLPLKVRRRDDGFRLSAKPKLADLYPQEASPQDRCRLRVRVLWENSSWQTFVDRPATGPTGLEVGFGLADEWLLTRR